MKRNKSLNRKKAISLIVLVITIIIIVIIATTGVVLVAKSGIFHSSTELTFKNDMSQYSDRIKNYFGSKVSDENENIRISGENLVEYIPELKDSKYLDKLYVLDGELVIDGSKITEDEKNWAKEIGIHVSDSLEIIGLDVVTTENTIEIKSINTSGNIPKGVKYKFKLDDNEKESTTSSYTFDKLESGKYYLVNVSIVSSEGQELASYKKNIKTRINNDVVDIKLSTENWTKGPIKVTLEYENIPQAYKIQYKIGKEEFKDYTKEFEVTENNTFIYARLYNKDVGRDTSNNYVEIKNIDKEVPLKPTAISATSGINSIKVRASGSQDSLSGILGYKYSLDGITYTSAIKAYEDYTFTNINADTIKTIYTKAVDNVGNESEVYSKDWATWEASEKVKISIDPSEDLWTNKAVTVSLSHQSIPTNYIMQYRINNGSWTDGYTAKVTENRTKIEARLYNKNLNDEIGLNSLTIGNIDRIVPNVISAEFNPTKNTIEVSNIVAKDEGGSGIANYELSIKKHSDIYYTPYTSEQNKYTFEGLVKDTLYDIHIRVYDKAGNVSDYYSKSIPTVCTITLDSQGADSGKEGTKTIYEKYEKGFYDTEDCINKITSISIPQKTGFVFDGYYTEKNGQGTKMIDGAGNITTNLKNSYYTSAGTLYANWVAKKITVIFMRNTTANDTTSDTQEFTYGVTGQSFSAKGWTKKGYTLLGWHEDKNSTAKRYNITSGVQNTWIESKYNESSNHTVTLYAIWQPNTYTVKYNGNGATGGTTANSSHTYDVDKKLTKNGYTRAYTVTYNHNHTGSTNTTKTATYSFVNWNTAANDTGTKYADEATVKNLTAANNGIVNLYAIWKSASLTYVPTRTGYVFDGWFEDANCTKRATSNNGVYTPTVNKTLYAKWIANTYTVNYDYSTNGGTSTTAENSTLTYNSDIDLTPTATKSGWEFVGWNTNKDAKTKLTSVKVTQNITLYAIYKKTVTATCNYYNGSVTTSSGTMYNNATSVSVKLPKIESITINSIEYTPRGWSSSANANGVISAASEASVALSSNATYYASYVKSISIKIYYCSGDGTNSTTSGNKVSNTSVSGNRYINYKGTVVNSSITVPSTVTGSKGFCGTKFSGVSKEKNSITNSTLDTSSTTYYAIYKKNVTLYYYNGSKHTSSVVIRNVTTDGTTYTSKEGSTIPTPASYDGAAFKGWSYTNDAVNKRTFNATGVNVLYAYYQKTITVSYNKNGGTGTIASVSGTKTYISKAVSTNASTAITTIKPTIKVSSGSGFTKKGYVFSGWNTKADSSGTNYTKSTAYTFSSNTTLYAKWSLATYKITLHKNGGTGGADAVYEWYSKGIYKEASHTNLVTGASGITTPTKANHRFDGYYTTKTGGTQLINGGGFISNFTDTYFTSNATIYARWKCTHDFGNYVTAGNENHRRTCKICGLTQTAAHKASNTKCNSTTLVIESLIETNTTRYIYEAKCSNYDNCKGRVNYYRKISDGKLSPGTIMNYSKYYDSNGNLVGVDKCPRVKCSVCGAWFTP